MCGLWARDIAFSVRRREPFPVFRKLRERGVFEEKNMSDISQMNPTCRRLRFHFRSGQKTALICFFKRSLAEKKEERGK